MKRQGFDFDGALKDLFQSDQPVLLHRITGGIGVRSFLNVEFPKVLERRCDLVLQLVDGSLLHLELQSENDGEIAYRMGIYGLLLGQTHKRTRIRQAVLYLGNERLRMRRFLRVAANTVSFEMTDIRDIHAEVLLRTGCPADFALAVLAGGGAARVREIIRKIGSLRGAQRERALAQLLILSGLRGLPSRVKWEIDQMGVIIDIKKNPVLMQWQREFEKEGREVGRQQGLEEGRELGRELGREEGRLRALEDLLTAKFGPLPRWAQQRLHAGKPADLDRWLRKVLTAPSLQSVLGKR